MQNQTAVKRAVCLAANADLVGVQAIDELDLGPIKVKLMRQDGEGWSRNQAEIAEKWYKGFLSLCLKYPSLAIVPNKAVDAFWHYHILDTRKYAEDCQGIFGYFLHHFPYFGMRDEKDVRDHGEAVANTKDLFHREFGWLFDEMNAVFPAYADGSAYADCNGEPICRSSPDDKISGVDFSVRPALH